MRFTDCNATRIDARHAANPNIVRFDVVRARSMFDVAPDLQRFYRAEVLVPSPLPRHLIIIPSKAVKMRKKHPRASASSKTMSAAVEGGDLSISDPTIAESAVVCGARRSSSKSSSSAFSTASASTTTSKVHFPQLAEGEAATSLSSHAMVRSALEGSETRPVTKFNVSAGVSAASVVATASARASAASASVNSAQISRRMCDVPRTSTLWQRHLERKERLFNLVDAEHVLTCEQFSFDPGKPATLVSRMPRPVESPTEVGGCQMPLSSSAACQDCALVFYNCPRHMRPCNAPVWIACGDCQRLLCSSHIFCYCEMKSFAAIHPASLAPADVTVALTDAHPAALGPTAGPPARKPAPTAASPARKPMNGPDSLSSRPSASASSIGTARKLMVVPVLSASSSSVGTAAVRRSSRLGRADVCKIPANEPVLMSKCAVNARALSVSNHVPPTARRVTPANLSKSAAVLRVSKHVPHAAQCVLPATVPVEAVSMPKAVDDVEKVPLSASTRDAPAARCVTINAVSTSSAMSKVKKVISLCRSPNRSK